MKLLRLTLRKAMIPVLAIVASTAQAATAYKVRELPVEAPAVTEAYPVARSIDSAGRVLVNVMIVRDQQAYHFSERCRVKHCRQLEPRNRQALWSSMNDTGATAGELWQGDISWAARRVPGQGSEYLTPGLAHGVNLQSFVVGMTRDGQPFMYDTSLHLLPIPLGASGAAYAINDSGVVVGGFTLRSGNTHPFIHKNGVTIDLMPDAPKHADGAAVDINNAGVAVGSLQLQGQGSSQAVRFEGDRVIYLGTLADGTRTGTHARAISESGRFVVGDGGVDPLDAGVYHGFVHDGAGLHDLNDLLLAEDASRYLIARAMDVNDAGQISAVAIRKADGRSLAVRLDPQP